LNNRRLFVCIDTHVDTDVAPDTHPCLNMFNTLQTLLNAVKSQPTNNVSCTPVYIYHQHVSLLVYYRRHDSPV